MLLFLVGQGMNVVLLLPQTAPKASLFPPGAECGADE